MSAHPSTVLFYVGGHGFGHATRTNAVIRALLSCAPDLRILVRTRAPQSLFDPRVDCSEACFEPDVVETDGSLGVDMQRTAEALDRFLAALPGVVEQEVAFVRNHNVSLIVADIPFAAGLVGAASSIPCVAAANFLWSWILDGVEGSDEIRRAYSLFSLALRYPLSHQDGWEMFPTISDVALVTPRSQGERNEIRSDLGASPDDVLVLIAGRAFLSGTALSQLRSQSPQYRFIQRDALPNYHDLVRGCDVVVSKAGYSTAAECIAEEKPLVYPPRIGFREDEMLLPQLHRFGRAVALSAEAWSTGNWAPYLIEAMGIPKPEAALPTNGAQQCAEILLESLS